MALRSQATDPAPDIDDTDNNRRDHITYNREHGSRNERDHHALMSLPDHARSVALCVGLAALLVLAGCGGTDQDMNVPTTGSGATAVDEPTSQPTQTSNQTTSLGITNAGITDMQALVDAHAAFIANHSTVTRTNATAVAPNGSVLYTVNGTTRTGVSDGSVVATADDRISYSVNYTGERFGPNSTLTHTDGFLMDGELYLRETHENGSVNYVHRSNGGSANSYGLSTTLISGYLGDANQTNAPVETRQVNGSTRYVVAGNLSRSEQPTHYRLSIDQQGVTRDFRVTRPVFGKEAYQEHTHSTIESTGSDEPLEVPSWVEEAKRQTGQQTTSGSATGDETTHLGTSESPTSAATESGNTTIDGLVKTTTA